MKQLTARGWFLITAGLVIVLQTIDGFVTTAVIDSGVGREGNSLLVGVAGETWFGVAKLLVTAAVIGVLYWRIRGQDKDYRRATKVLAGLGVFYACVVAWNAYWLFAGTVVWAGL